MTDSPTEDELLATLRRMVGESSVRRVAKRMGIAHTTLGELLDPETKRRPYGPTLEKISAYISHEGRSVVREAGPRYAASPSRLAIAIGALEVIRDAADAALRRAAPRSADAIAETAAEALAEKRRLGVSAKHGRRQGPRKRA